MFILLFFFFLCDDEISWSSLFLRPICGSVEQDVSVSDITSRHSRDVSSSPSSPLATAVHGRYLSLSKLSMGELGLYLNRSIMSCFVIIAQYQQTAPYHSYWTSNYAFHDASAHLNYFWDLTFPNNSTNRHMDLSWRNPNM